MVNRKWIKIKPLIDDTSNNTIVGAVKSRLGTYIELYLVCDGRVYVNSKDKYEYMVIDLPPVPEVHFNNAGELSKEYIYRHIFKTVKEYISNKLELSHFTINVESYYLKVVEEGIHIPRPSIVTMYVEFDRCLEFIDCLELTPSETHDMSGKKLVSNKTITDTFKY